MLILVGNKKKKKIDGYGFGQAWSSLHKGTFLLEQMKPSLRKGTRELTKQVPQDLQTHK